MSQGGHVTKHWLHLIPTLITPHTDTDYTSYKSRLFMRWSDSLEYSRLRSWFQQKTSDGDLDNWQYQLTVDLTVWERQLVAMHRYFPLWSLFMFFRSNMSSLVTSVRPAGNAGLGEGTIFQWIVYRAECLRWCFKKGGRVKGWKGRIEELVRCLELRDQMLI